MFTPYLYITDKDSFVTEDPVVLVHYRERNDLTINLLCIPTQKDLKVQIQSHPCCLETEYHIFYVW